MAFSNETVELLTKGVPFYDRQGPKGVKFKYVKTEDVIQRLNEAFGHAWSSDVVKSETSGDFVVVLVRLTANGISKAAYGGAQAIRSRKDNSIMDLGNVYKSAFANALKGAAKQFGVGLYEEEEEAEEAPKKYSKPNLDVGKAHGTETTASVSTTVKVQKPVSSKDSMLEKAKALMAAKEKESKEESTPFPTTSDEGTATDIQITAIQKLCARAEKTEEQVLSEARNKGVIKSDAKTADRLKKNEGAAMIRFLTHKKAGNE
jgi:hypothetical protein